MNRLKRKSPYYIGLIISFLSFLCMLLPFFAVKETNFKYNLYIMLSLSSLGFWHVLLCIFVVLFIITLILVIVLSLLEIFKDLKIVEFKITVGKINSYMLLKALLFVLLTISAIMMILTWFMILANADYSLVFGAGPFILIVILLIATIIFVFLERAEYFKNWEQLKTSKAEDQKQDVAVEEDLLNDNKEEEIVIDPQNQDK